MKFNFLNKIFGSTNDRKINALAPIVEQINSLEEDIEKLSDTQLFDKASNLKKLLRVKKILKKFYQRRSH